MMRSLRNRLLAAGFGLAVAATAAVAAFSAAPASGIAVESGESTRKSAGSSPKAERPGARPADAKAGRLPGAEVAALQARRPDLQAARRILGHVLRDALYRAEQDRLFAALQAKRPDRTKLKVALLPAMAGLVMVAPRATDSTLALAEAEDVAPPAEAIVELAALPAEGPLPDRRPGAVPGSARERDGLAAIAAIAPRKSEGERGSARALAYARPDNPLRDEPELSPSPQPKWPGVGGKVAVYDISAGVVHMPNGTRLEAHSGVGAMRDKPQYAHVKMRGPTPPGTYKLTMRERPFHGVAAIRMNPVDGKAPLGRTGLLAHSYLLRNRPGDSHGCVAFAQYERFLRAFRRGEVTHMVVVAKYDGRRPGGNMNLVNFLRGGKKG